MSLTFYAKSRNVKTTFYLMPKEGRKGDKHHHQKLLFHYSIMSSHTPSNFPYQKTQTHPQKPTAQNPQKTTTIIKPFKKIKQTKQTKVSKKQKSFRKSHISTCLIPPLPLPPPPPPPPGFLLAPLPPPLLSPCCCKCCACAA